MRWCGLLTVPERSRLYTLCFRGLKKLARHAANPALVDDALHPQNPSPVEQSLSCCALLIMLLSVAVLCSIIVSLAWKLLHILEKRNYWTLCLRLSLTYEYCLILLYSLLLYSVLEVCWGLPLEVETHGDPSKHVLCSVSPICWVISQTILRHQTLWQIMVSILACCVSGFYSWDLISSREYRKLRWQVWSDPSRTGIPSALAC